MHQSCPSLNLLVIRSAGIERAAEFFRAAGVQLDRHSHNGGPEHYTGDLGGCVFEIYPLQGAALPSQGVRFGILVSSLNSIIPHLVEVGGELIQPPHDSEWGRRAVVRDPDGHVVEFLERKYNPV